MRAVMIPVMVGAALSLVPAKAQQIDFGRIRSFESMGTGEVHGAAPAKAIISDHEPHAIVLTIWDSNTDAKVSWTSLDDAAPQTAVLHGTTMRAFQTAGEFKVEAVGNADQTVKYDYVLLRLTKEKE